MIEQPTWRHIQWVDMGQFVILKINTNVTAKAPNIIIFNDKTGKKQLSYLFYTDCIIIDEIVLLGRNDNKLRKNDRIRTSPFCHPQ